MTVILWELVRLFGLTAVAVMVFGPSSSSTPVAVNVPSLTVATIPFTLTVAELSLMVPDTSIGEPDTVSPSPGEVMTTTGAEIGVVVSLATFIWIR